ncbi:hypothetical protein PAXINDRAFT_14707 [Paxillus involutus ATCC 200175]|uniref:Uncharacterized protein n=1 Tax=Paxillus involutus ATCC 200175 TaxID=664439 RepID=A0A0C9TPP2_PAXIN|nr:hypothetical protein PAXINDRAFT_14707 [Paxillus involutus ATCC 200175]
MSSALSKIPKSAIKNNELKTSKRPSTSIKSPALSPVLKKQRKKQEEEKKAEMKVDTELKHLNQQRAKENLQEVKMTAQRVVWVNTPPEVEVQETLHSLKAENKELGQKIKILETKIEDLTKKLEEAIKDYNSAKVTQQPEGDKKKEGSGYKEHKGRGHERGGRRGGATTA